MIHDILHINIRVPQSKLARCRDFYCDILGLEVGPRPPFNSTGYWLYADGAPVVHLVAERPAAPAPDSTEAASAPAALTPDLAQVASDSAAAGPDPERAAPERGHVSLDHVAFRCTGLRAVLDKLAANGITYRTSTVPGLDIMQVSITDPAGVGIELSFESGTNGK